MARDTWPDAVFGDAVNVEPRRMLRSCCALVGALGVAGFASRAWAEAPATVQADKYQAGLMTAKGRSTDEVGESVAAARKRACGDTKDPILGCGAEDITEPNAIDPFIVRFEKGGLGLNAGLASYFPWWGTGLDMAVMGGGSVRLWSWFYEGLHRISVLQLDVDAGYRFVGEPRGMWYAALGPVYQGVEWVGPVIKAQVFVSRPMSWTGFDSGGRIDAMGITVSVGLDWPSEGPDYLAIDPTTAKRTKTGKAPSLDKRARAYLFQNAADDEEAEKLRQVEQQETKALESRGQPQGNPR